MTRVLAIDPTTKGFAYAVFEGSDFLLDWGLTQVLAERKNELCLKRVEALLVQYAPDAVVLEAYDGKGSHRRPRVRSLIRSIKSFAARRHFRTRCFSRGEIRRAFAALAETTRHPIAEEIVRRFPQLTLRLPEVRKFYESEDERMSIFDAVSLALTYFAAKEKRPEPLAEAA